MRWMLSALLLVAFSTAPIAEAKAAHHTSNREARKKLNYKKPKHKIKKHKEKQEAAVWHGRKR